MNLKRVSEPLYEPISADDVKLHLRVDSDMEYGYIQALITVARMHVESVCLRTLMPTTWELQLDAWPDTRMIRLPMPPLRSVTSITYVDRAGTTHAMSVDDYVVDTWSEPGRIALRSASWPMAQLREVAGVRIRYLAGYADALTSNSSKEQITAARNAVPALAKHAIKLLVGHLYENREEVVIGQGLTMAQTPMGVNYLLASMRYSVKEW